MFSTEEQCVLELKHARRTQKIVTFYLRALRWKIREAQVLDYSRLGTKFFLDDFFTG